MRTVILLRNLNNQEDQERIKKALNETRTTYEVNLGKKCVIIEGNNDMVAVARKVLQDEGFLLL